MPFLHLATEQSMFNNVLPYDAYCGGAWLARVGFFQQLGGMPAAYVGYEGAEDEFCRRVAVVSCRVGGWVGGAGLVVVGSLWGAVRRALCVRWVVGVVCRGQSATFALRATAACRPLWGPCCAAAPPCRRLGAAASRGRSRGGAGSR